MIKKKLLALIREFFGSSKMGVGNRVILETLAKQILTDVDESTLRKGIETLRDKFIPFLLEE